MVTDNDEICATRCAYFLNWGVKAQRSCAYTNVGSNRINKMTPRQIGAILTFVSLWSCSKPTSDNQVDNVTTDSTQIESIKTNDKKPKTVDTVANNNDESGCIRGQAESVINKSVYPNATFKLNEDNRTGTETVRIKNGDKLTINNWGCEYYALTFRFETNRFSADTTDINYWTDKGFELMREIKSGLDAPLDIEGG
ncbi:MAG: hypothetical protein ACKO96_26340, partial [Flammeovirgaceae bacterium]